MSFQTDNLEIVYNELKPLEAEIEAAGKNIRVLADSSARARADYELLKNRELIALYKEESKPDFYGKRTEAQRTAIYRAKYSDERLAANLAENNLKAERDYLTALQSKLMAIQTRARLLETERRLTN